MSRRRSRTSRQVEHPDPLVPHCLLQPTEPSSPDVQTVTGRKIRVGLASCGRISRNHFGSSEVHGADIELAAVCDTDLATLAAHKEKYPVLGYEHLEDMLRSEDLDLVALCTPSGLHPDQTVLGAKYGVSVLTEKPMATHWRDGVRMVRACDQANVRLFVVKQNRRNSTLQMLKRAFDEGRFGRVYMVSINVFWRSGALGSMSVTMLTYPKNLEGSITVLGEKGTVRIGGVAANEIQVWDFADQRDYDAKVRTANDETTSVYGFGHPLYYKNVVDVLRGEAEPEVDGREGLKSLEVLIAACLSARDGRDASLPLEY